ncbi:MAG: MFS transporter [Mycobacteriales bacterium]|nr:MFS transporter [Frankia sp.]
MSDAPPEVAPRGYVRLLREERDFRRVYASQLISLGGDWFAVIPLLTLLARLTHGGLWGGLVLGADTLVFALVAPYAGTVVDRVDRRRLMVGADIVSAALVLLLLLVRSPATAWIAVLAIGGVAAVKSFYTPASTAALPNLVPRADLSTASVLSGASWGSMLAVGAALGGLVALAIGERGCFVLDALSFLLSASLTARTSKPFGQARERPPSSVRADLRETVHYARSEPRVLALLCVKFGPGLGTGALALLPLFALAVYHVGPAGTGLLFSARGLGALIGPLALRRLVLRNPTTLWPVLTGCVLAFGVSYMLLAFTPWYAVALLLVAIAHFGGGANWILSTYALQSTVPDHIAGRVFSADYMIATLAIGLSQTVTGLLSEHFDIRWVAFGLGAATASYSVAWWLATRSLRRPAAALAAQRDATADRDGVAVRPAGG